MSTETNTRISTRDGWITIVRELRGCELTWKKMLSANAALPLRLKYALDGSNRIAMLQGEFLADEEDLAVMCRDMVEAWPHAANSQTGATTQQQDNQSQGLADLCQQAGWQTESRANGVIVVPLQDGRHIRLDGADDGVRLAISYGPAPDAGSLNAKALHHLLLTLSHRHRLVRPVLRAADEGDDAHFEIESGFPMPLPDAENLARALSALAAASAACGSAFDALLRNENLASEYLAVRLAKNQQDTSQT